MSLESLLYERSDNRGIVTLPQFSQCFIVESTTIVPWESWKLNGMLYLDPQYLPCGFRSSSTTVRFSGFKQCDGVCWSLARGLVSPPRNGAARQTHNNS